MNIYADIAGNSAQPYHLGQHVHLAGIINVVHRTVGTGSWLAQMTYAAYAVGIEIMLLHIISIGYFRIRTMLTHRHGAGITHTTGFRARTHDHAVLLISGSYRDGAVLATDVARGITFTVMAADRLARDLHLAELMDMDGQVVNTSCDIALLGTKTGFDFYIVFSFCNLNPV